MKKYSYTYNNKIYNIDCIIFLYYISKICLRFPILVSELCVRI